MLAEGIGLSWVMEAGCSDQISVELDAEMYGGISLTPSALHFQPPWCQVAIPALSQTTIRGLFFI